MAPGTGSRRRLDITGVVPRLKTAGRIRRRGSNAQRSLPVPFHFSSHLRTSGGVLVDDTSRRGWRRQHYGLRRRGHGLASGRRRVDRREHDERRGRHWRDRRNHHLRSGRQRVRHGLDGRWKFGRRGRKYGLGHGERQLRNRWNREHRRERDRNVQDRDGGPVLAGSGGGHDGRARRADHHATHDCGRGYGNRNDHHGEREYAAANDYGVRRRTHRGGREHHRDPHAGSAD